LSADPILVDTVNRLLTSTCGHEQVEAAETEGLNHAAWTALSEAGFDRVGLAESAGGSGGTVQDMAAVLRAIGRHAAAVPVAETGFIAGWLLAELGMDLPTGAITIAERSPSSRADLVDGRLVGEVDAPWARHCTTVVVAVEVSAGLTVLSVPVNRSSLTPGANLAGEARDRLRIDLDVNSLEHVTVPSGPGLESLHAELDARHLIARALLASGALETVTRMSVEYTNARRQFGKPVATFQAVQHHLVDLAESAVMARMAADVAVERLSRDTGSPRPVVFEAAAARIVVDDAIRVATAAAHQSHGAMGVTREYSLQQFTRRLWSWRHEHGTTTSWERQLGSLMAEFGPDELFATISG
jgi:acyl-CoA dehydrogenase